MQRVWQAEGGGQAAQHAARLEDALLVLQVTARTRTVAYQGQQLFYMAHPVVVCTKEQAAAAIAGQGFLHAGAAHVRHLQKRHGPRAPAP